MTLIPRMCYARARARLHVAAILCMHACRRCCFCYEWHSTYIRCTYRDTPNINTTIAQPELDVSNKVHHTHIDNDAKSYKLLDFTVGYRSLTIIHHFNAAESVPSNGRCKWYNAIPSSIISERSFSLTFAIRNITIELKRHWRLIYCALRARIAFEKI